ncbi:hypothetical protein D6764_03665 [Candidatus Woesearchaeota archaeon]|nr:MAG: hypothetical protein D6764_03665 [Candidatus Woesearchaeota archaeon]
MTKRLLIIVLLVASLMLAACSRSNSANDESISSEEAYTKCTGVCASVITDDYTTQWLCYEECKKRFLMKDDNASA